MNCPAIRPTFTVGTPVLYVSATAICRITLSLSRIESAENASKLSAQSPAWSRNPSPSATAASDSGEVARLAGEHERRERADLLERGLELLLVGPVGLLPGRVVPPQRRSAPGRRRRRCARLTGTRPGPGHRPRAPGTDRAPGCRICSSCCCADACWVKIEAWMPWNRPSSQPTSCACASRSSESLGVSVVNGRTTSLSSRVRSGESTPSSSWIDCSWIARRRRRPSSSSGARRTSSSIVRTIDAMRISLVGRVTCSDGSARAPAGTGRRRRPRASRASRSGRSGCVGRSCDGLGFVGHAPTIGAGGRRRTTGVRRLPGPAPVARLAHARRDPPDAPAVRGPGHVVEPVRLGLAARAGRPSTRRSRPR